MTQNVSLHLPSSVVFGQDVLPQLGPIARTFGTRGLLVTESVLHEGNHIARTMEILKRAGLEMMVYDELTPTSNATRINEVASLARASKSKVIIGLGGMRVLSVARCVANIAAGTLKIGDIMEGQRPEASIPYIEVPSSFRNHLMMRDEAVIRDSMAERVRIVQTVSGTVRAALVETSFSQTLSGKYALAAILDTLLAAIEGFFSPATSLFSDALLERAIRELHGAAVTGSRQPTDGRFRVRAAEAGLITAMALGVTGQGMGGALAYGINARFGLPKSWVAGILLPHVMEYLASKNVDKAARVAAALGESVTGISANDDAPRSVRGIRKLVSQLDLPIRLRDLDVTMDELSHCAEQISDLNMLSGVPGGAGVTELQRLVSIAY